MRCKEAENKLLENPKGIAPDLVRHLSECRRCSQFRDDIERIRGGLRELPRPAPRKDLADQTRARCLAAIAADTATSPCARPETPPAPVPVAIWAALAALIILTGLIMIPGLGELIDRTRSLLSAAVLALLLQNAVTLILAPILLRACRNRPINIEGFPMNGNAS